MAVRAKFKVTKKDDRPTYGGHAVDLELQAVKREGGNESWSNFTPAGLLSMTVTNPHASEQFEVGRSYFLDFTPAD